MLSRGASTLLDFLRRKGAGKADGCFWKQANIAKELKCSRASIIRWVAELREAGHIACRRRGSTSNVYRISESASKFAVQQLLLQNATTAPCPSLLSECNTPKQASSRARGEIIELPPALLPTGHPNPVRIELNRRMRAAEGRIRAARHPEAYERAILREELGKLTQAQPSKTTKTVFDGFVGSVSVDDPELEAFIREHEANLAAQTEAQRPIISAETRRKTPQPGIEWSTAVLGSLNALSARKALGRSP